MFKRLKVALFFVPLIWMGCGGGHSRPPEQHVSWGHGDWLGSATSSDGQKFYFTFIIGGSGQNRYQGYSIQFTPATTCFGNHPYLILQANSGFPPDKIDLDIWSDSSKEGRHFQGSVTFPVGAYTGTGKYTITNSTGSCINSNGDFELSFIPGAW
jgi:hypothetical protein